MGVRVIVTMRVSERVRHKRVEKETGEHGADDGGEGGERVVAHRVVGGRDLEGEEDAGDGRAKVRGEAARRAGDEHLERDVLRVAEAGKEREAQQRGGDERADVHHRPLDVREDARADDERQREHLHEQQPRAQRLRRHRAAQRDLHVRDRAPGRRGRDVLRQRERAPREREARRRPPHQLQQPRAAEHVEHPRAPLQQRVARLLHPIRHACR